MRRHHVISIGVLTSLIGAYQFAAQLGVVPRNPLVLLNSIPAAKQISLPGSGPILAGYPSAGPAQPGYPQGGNGNGWGAGTQDGYGNGYHPPGAGGEMYWRFSPSGGCTEAVVAEINQARRQILVQAYSFTSAPIVNALVDAHGHGVAVFIILDKSQTKEQYSGADYVAQAGIPTLIDSAHAIAHNKIMLIDGHTVITGSFNFTANAERSNAENLLVIRDRPDLYAAYEENFRHHYEHSQPHQPGGWQR